MAREFKLVPAVREKVPMWVSICGPSGAGKTLSALRLATGMSRVYGDGVAVIDTEARRSAHYADSFKFSMVDFKPDFGPTDYLDAIQHCLKNGARTIIIDSMSHEWEGQGGVLEQHDKECDRLAQSWRTTRDKVQMSAWQKPKGDHRKLLGFMLQSGANYILCYRAREKLKVIQGRPPQPLGWQPVGPDDLVYEATLSMLLLPGAKGVPQWNPSEEAEKSLVKLPRQFEKLFDGKKPLDEETGEQLALWASGGTASTAPSVGATSSGNPANGQVATSTTATKAAAPKANPAALEMLSAQLSANGITTKEARREWFFKVTGKAIAEATENDVARAIEQAEVEAA